MRLIFFDTETTGVGIKHRLCQLAFTAVEANIAVAHNAKFDVDMLAKEGINVANYICTLKLARHLDVGGFFTNYKMQYLRYALKLKVDAKAHDAEGDVEVLKALFERLYDGFKDKAKPKLKSQAKYCEAMVRISTVPSNILKFTFGKYKGRLISDIATEDKSYLTWLRKSERAKGDEANEDMLNTLKKYI